MSQAIQWMETDQGRLEKKTTAALIVANMARNGKSFRGDMVQRLHKKFVQLNLQLKYVAYLILILSRTELLV